MTDTSDVHDNKTYSFQRVFSISFPSPLQAFEVSIFLCVPAHTVGNLQLDSCSLPIRCCWRLTVRSPCAWRLHLSTIAKVITRNSHACFCGWIYGIQDALGRIYSVPKPIIVSAAGGSPCVVLAQRAQEEDGNKGPCLWGLARC
jgi:hypothetical protein